MPKQHKQKLKTSGKDEFVAKFISVHKRAEKHCTNSLSRSFPTIKKREGLYTDEWYSGKDSCVCHINHPFMLLLRIV